MAPKRTAAGTWQVRWRDDRGRQRAKTFPRQQQAIDFERTTLVDIRRGVWVDPDRGKITVQAWASQWLDGAHNLRPRSIETYQAVINHVLPVLGHIPIGRVTSEHIDAYLKAKAAAGLAPSTVHRHYRTLRRLFSVAVRRGRIPRSPLDTVEAPRVPDIEMRFLTATEVEALAEAIDPRYRTLILVAAWGGPRWGELAGLQCGRVDVAGSRVHIVRQLDPDGRNPAPPKTAAGRRWVSLPQSVTDELAAHIDGRSPDQPVWTSPRGMPMRNAVVRQRYFLPACIATGIGAMIEDDGVERYEGPRLHDLRHTSVALAIAGGAHPKAIQARMGHANISITLDRYGHLFPQLEEQLAASLDDARSKTLTERRRLHVV